MQQFELVLKDGVNNEFSIELLARPYKRAGVKETPKPKKVAELKSMVQVTLAKNLVKTVLRENGYEPKQLKERNYPFTINEESGVMMALIMLVVSRISDPLRIENAIYGISNMANEERAYWYGMTYTRKSKAVKALRVLVS